MRKEDKMHPGEQANSIELRLNQIDECHNEAQRLNVARMSDTTLKAYTRILSEQKTGTDIASLDYIRGHEDLIRDSIPILSQMITSGYLTKFFNKLSTLAVLNIDDRFPLLEINGSPDSSNLEQGRDFLSMFAHFPEAVIIVNEWTQQTSSLTVLEAIQAPELPILTPNMRRDFAAVTGRLEDLKGTLGGAEIILPTKIAGISLEFSYSSGIVVFPKAEIVAKHLR